MLHALLPLLVFAGVGHQAPTPSAPVVEDTLPAMGVPAAVAQALVDADQILAVRQAAGIVVFDLDRASEHFQLTVAIDDDGGVVDSTIDWVGATGERLGVAPVALNALPVVERIDWEPSHGVLVLRGAGHEVRLRLDGDS